MKTLHELVADKVEREPAPLRIPLENIDRWLANGHTAPHRLEHWRQIILRAQESDEGFKVMFDVLRARNESAERLRDFAPFAGTLTTAEHRLAVSGKPYHY